MTPKTFGASESFGGSEALRLWERVDGLGPVDRALALAVAGDSPGSAATLRSEPLGRCNARLLRLRSAAFGTSMAAVARCPACDAEVEFSVDAADLADLDASDPRPVERNGYVVSWRSPAPADLAAAAQAIEVGEDPEQVLLRRCVTSAVGPGGAEVDPTRLPYDVRNSVDQAMADADPLAEVIVDLVCPGCGLAFGSDLDLPSFVWAELQARARRVLLDVDVLARAYGWTEADVLALGDTRRAAYLRMVIEGLP